MNYDCRNCNPNELMCKVCGNDSMVKNINGMLSKIPNRIHLRRDIADTSAALASFYYNKLNNVTKVVPELNNNLRQLCVLLNNYIQKKEFIKGKKEGMRQLIRIDNGEPIYSKQLIQSEYYATGFDTYDLMNIINTFWNIKKYHSRKIKAFSKLANLFTYFNLFTPFLCVSPNGKPVDCLI